MIELIKTDIEISPWNENTDDTEFYKKIHYSNLKKTAQN
jgi:hypothetical protein